MFERFRRAGAGRTVPERLSPEQFKNRRTPESVVLDVRTPGEYAGGHVAGADLVDLQAPDFRDRVGRLDRDGTYYLYCRSGNRSGMAARIMREMGFAHVYDIGGLDALARAGVEVSR